MKTGKNKTEKQATLTMMAMIGGMVIAGSTLYQSVSYAQVNHLSIGDGTGVGNGSGGGRDQYLASLQNSLGQQNAMTSGSVDELISWCGRASIALQKGVARAMIQVRSNRQELAVQTLVDTLVKVGQSITVDPMSGGPMTKKLVDRTLKYSQRLDQDLPGNSGASLATKVNFLFNAVNFIIKAEKELDTPYYIPFRYRHHGRYPAPGCTSCSSQFDYSRFEMKFIKVAAQQLSFVMKSFTETGIQDGRLQVFPLGEPKAFLAVAEMASGFVAKDLRDNLHAYVNCRAISDLEALQSILIEYNMNQDRSIFPNTRWAVSEVADALNGIQSEIKIYSNSCGFTDTNYEFNYQYDYALGGEYHE